MLRKLTIDDYDTLFALWTNTPNMGLRSLDDSREGIAFSFAAILRQILALLKMVN